MKKKVSKIGILGGGQLAQMLSTEGQRLGFEIWILSENSSDPAAQVTSNWVKGSPKHSTDLLNFAEKVDLLTFESEFIDGEKLLHAGLSKKVLPQLTLMSTLRDRQTQKAWLLKNKIPTAPYHWPKNLSGADRAFSEFSKKVVFKQRLFGYDGNGTKVVRTEKELQSFKKILSNKPQDWIAEAFVPFKRELAVSFACGASEIRTLPLVETFQQNSRCLWVKGPVKSKQWPLLERKIRNVLKKEFYRGLVTFELFETKSGELMVNEVAPRVHNSAHHSLESLTLSQFALHLLAIGGYPLPPVELVRPGFAMWNLLGSGQLNAYEITPLKYAKLHWYGKSKMTVERKLGHLTCLSSTPMGAHKLAKSEQKRILR